MYKVLEVEDDVKVPASKMGLELTDAIEKSVQDQYEGVVNPELGVVLAVEDVSDVGDGRMVPGEGAVYYPAKFNLLTYMPQEHEVIVGEIVDITEFGAFVRMGPLDGLVHISQVMNDYVSLDKKNGVLAGKESKRVLKKGDVVRARIISVSFAKEAKIGLTMRQPQLGAIHWLEGLKERKEPKISAQDAETSNAERLKKEAKKEDGEEAAKEVKTAEAATEAPVETEQAAATEEAK
ncbi:MAG: DNA-directed RNA polymerase [Candidatus Aenigmatarchaeota archaeon]|nr:MAG: DNA-directed RNA polymerase [Candidatus Aenigmarchaeota archaeon]